MSGRKSSSIPTYPWIRLPLPVRLGCVTEVIGPTTSRTLINSRRGNDCSFEEETGILGRGPRSVWVEVIYVTNNRLSTCAKYWMWGTQSELQSPKRYLRRWARLRHDQAMLRLK